MTSTEYRRNAERLLTRQPGFTPTPAMVAEADTVRADHLDGPGFATLCQKGRKLRQDTGQLSGDAVGDVTAAADAAGVTVPPVLSDVLEVMRHSVRMYTADLLAALVNLDEDVYGDFDAERLAAELTAAACRPQVQASQDQRRVRRRIPTPRHRRRRTRRTAPRAERVKGSPSTRPLTPGPRATPLPGPAGHGGPSTQVEGEV